MMDASREAEDPGTFDLRCQDCSLSLDVTRRCGESSPPSLCQGVKFPPFSVEWDLQAQRNLAGAPGYQCCSESSSRERERQRQRERETETERQRQSERVRERHRQTDRQTEQERERDSPRWQLAE